MYGPTLILEHILEIELWTIGNKSSLCVAFSADKTVAICGDSASSIIFIDGRSNSVFDWQNPTKRWK